MLLRQPPAVGVGEVRALRDAEQRVVRFVHMRGREVGVVGGDDRHRGLRGDRQQGRFGGRLALQAVSQQLDVEPIAESLAQLRHHCLRGFPPALQQQSADGPVRTAGQDDQSVRVRAQAAERHARVGLRFREAVGECQQAQQVGVSGGILHQDDDRVPPGGGYALPSPLPQRRLRHRQRELAADDRLHPHLPQRRGELHAAEQIVGIGDRHRRHRVVDAQLRQIFDANGALGERVGGVHPKVNEVAALHAGRSLLP